MPGNLLVEELVIDDSFNNYCLHTNEADVLFWQQYITTHPYEKAKIEEACEMVLALHTMLQQEYAHNDRKENIKDIVPTHRTTIIKKIVRYSAAIAAVLIIVLALKSYWKADIRKSFFTQHPTVKNRTEQALVFSTAKGQKKQISLSDGTTIVLNAGSSLHTDKNFGTKNRTVYLSGEALFDVTHDADLPFVVHVANYDIKVLGTLFNVKAYPGEQTSETALLRGKVQIVKKDGGDLTLVPNQKVIFKNTAKAIAYLDSGKGTPSIVSIQKIVPVSFDSKDSTVMETAWAENRLEIVNEHFADMKETLERWYNVKIIFKDAEVRQYTFTATFENETIQQVLQALQYAYPFHYKIQGNEITISK